MTKIYIIVSTSVRGQGVDILIAILVSSHRTKFIFEKCLIKVIHI